MVRRAVDPPFLPHPLLPPHQPPDAPSNPLRSPYAPSINLKPGSLIRGLLLTKSTARRSFESISPYISRLGFVNLFKCMLIIFQAFACAPTFY